MNPCRMLLVSSLLLISLAACDSGQPSGVPETETLPPTAVPTQQPQPSPPPVVAEIAAPAESAPPLDAPIPPYEKTGFPDCDDYIEAYRQCLNSRLGSDARKVRGHELHEAFRAISANIARGVDPTRVAALCKKSRKMAVNKVQDLGCTL